MSSVCKRLLQYRLLIPAFFLLLLGVLSGCEAVLGGTVIASGMAVNELNRHTLPKLEEIERIEVRFYPDADSHEPVTLNIIEPSIINKLVLVMNNNRSWWKNRFKIAPDSPNYFYSPQVRYISFWNKETLVRELSIRDRIITTRPEHQEISREVSLADSKEIYRLVSIAGSAR